MIIDKDAANLVDVDETGQPICPFCNVLWEVENSEEEDAYKHESSSCIPKLVEILAPRLVSRMFARDYSDALFAKACSTCGGTPIFRDLPEGIAVSKNTEGRPSTIELQIGGKPWARLFFTQGFKLERTEIPQGALDSEVPWVQLLGYAVVVNPSCLIVTNESGLEPFVCDGCQEREQTKRKRRDETDFKERARKDLERLLGPYGWCDFCGEYHFKNAHD